jgi:hypothetical protein
MSSATNPKVIALDEQRSRLERRANVIRSRLLRTIDALDSRRHQVQEIGHHAKRLAKPFAASLAGAALLAIGTTIAIKAVMEHRREKSAVYRLSKALAPLRAPAQRPFFGAALRRMTLAVLGMLAAEGAKRGVIALLAAPREGEPIALLGPKPETPSPAI